ncbi:MAG: efflux RND transporter periplasmic adaptor subunit [Alphaproteobacteria bacterium]|jgi:membrane fusion protein, heavy metal efflux system|uniref:efflux RND transporter periplasmic adaptor subunit n=1 Tax=Brevundimonas sp. TaxID=1871086 RepID=UPI001EB38558|nr:efflux RND transporter periplasmic adaptor subunit [Brevundimonas sp.]MBU1539191.1 efflux RND transporter periplasmic adaptor subunit [Alphaproteobacteria bacterium]MBU2041534.1 efflux RND transporter periplasmic adaptor subunit [Alphaproteobacteria bacterium]MBU2290168.1 efflux RND transporter periplasmic adaptor subunit [Alphaproteobacteria bacterium]MDO9076797.1 efflux RND transporter periplasmic adaptor subunit [Brevundimonas sp.]MDZ4109290.1 efflux RND transporter periplasmic adaptor s
MKKLTNQQRLLAGAAATVIILGGGYAGWSMTRAPEAAPEAQAAEEEAHGAGEALEMDAARIQAAGIVLEPVGSGALSAEIVAQGTVVGTPQGEAVLAARADGVISRVSLRLGDSVRAGQTVALIESREASTIAAERSAAQARLTAARQALAREQRLFDAQITARQDLEAAQTVLAEAQAESRRTSSAAAAARVSSDGRSTGVVSPISGRVTAADATLGAFVTAGTELFRVANASQIEIEAAVSAEDAARIASGDRASISLPEGEVPATVRSITPGVDAESRSATVILSLSGVGGLRPGQAVSARIYTRDAQTSGGLSVPEEAIQTVEGRDVVFVRTATGFTAAPVIVGQRSAGRAQITSGLRAGQTIAARNAFLLKAALGAGEVEH